MGENMSPNSESLSNCHPLSHFPIAAKYFKRKSHTLSVLHFSFNPKPMQSDSSTSWKPPISPGTPKCKSSFFSSSSDLTCPPCLLRMTPSWNAHPTPLLSPPFPLQVSPHLFTQDFSNMKNLLNLKTSSGKSDSCYNPGISICSLHLLQTPKYSDRLFFSLCNITKLVLDKSLKYNYFIFIYNYQ